MIEVTPMGGDDSASFDVVVSEGTGTSRHRVTASRADLARFGAASPERAIEAAFRFLLDREPKEAILARFDVSVIARYFPEFWSELPGYLGPPHS